MRDHFFHLEVLSETVEAKTVETLERGTEPATEGSKQENTEENNGETASESKQTEEETKQTEAETGTEERNQQRESSFQGNCQKEATEEIQQDGNLYDMGGEMRKASRVAKVGLRKAAGGLDSNYVYLDTTGMNLGGGPDWTTASQIYLFKNGVSGFIPGQKSTFMAKSIGDGKLTATMVIRNLHLYLCK